jgi:hypothetical protein
VVKLAAHEPLLRLLADGAGVGTADVNRGWEAAEAAIGPPVDEHEHGTALAAPVDD